MTCLACGQNAPWAAQCPACGARGTLVDVSPVLTRPRPPDAILDDLGPVPVAEVVADRTPRLHTGLPGLDTVLGGGLMPGGLYLLAGPPGIGKSTLLLQASQGLARCLWVTTEQTVGEVAQQHARLQLPAGPLFVVRCQTVQEVLEAVSRNRPVTLVLDALQALQGGRQAAEDVTLVLKAMTKTRGLTTILVSHVNKTRKAIAGSQAIEHHVDAVCWLRGSPKKTLRVARCTKNRYGPTTRVARWRMTARGLAATTPRGRSIRQAADDAGARPRVRAVKRPRAGGPGSLEPHE